MAPCFSRSNDTKVYTSDINDRQPKHHTYLPLLPEMPSAVINVTFKYKHSWKPLDVYSMADVSPTVFKKLREYIKAGSAFQVVDNIEQFSTDFRIGFGSFLDKGVGYLRRKRSAEDYNDDKWTPGQRIRP
jgi:hypothetical protein